MDHEVEKGQTKKNVYAKVGSTDLTSIWKSLIELEGSLNSGETSEQDGPETGIDDLKADINHMLAEQGLKCNLGDLYQQEGTIFVPTKRFIIGYLLEQIAQGRFQQSSDTFGSSKALVAKLVIDDEFGERSVIERYITDCIKLKSPGVISDKKAVKDKEERRLEQVSGTIYRFLKNEWGKLARGIPEESELFTLSRSKTAWKSGSFALEEITRLVEHPYSTLMYRDPSAYDDLGSWIKSPDTFDGQPFKFYHK